MGEDKTFCSQAGHQDGKMLTRAADSFSRRSKIKKAGGQQNPRIN